SAMTTGRLPLPTAEFNPNFGQLAITTGPGVLKYLSAEAPAGRWAERLPRWLTVIKPGWLPWYYLTLLALAELLTSTVNVQLGFGPDFSTFNSPALPLFADL